MMNEIENWYVYSYCFLDDLSFIRNPVNVIHDWKISSPFLKVDNIDDVIEAVKQRFLHEGWEGDGEIGLLWIPPFVDIGSEDTYGNYIWHVKQQNNGISWLLSPIKLDFQRLNKQNPWNERLEKKGLIPENIISIDVQSFIKDLTKSRERIIRQLTLLNQKGDTTAEREIVPDLLNHHQGQIIARFYNFLDYCYLRFLQDVILENNHYGIKIQKSSVSLSLTAYQPQNDAELENSPTWTLFGLIEDLWKAYKFEPASKKFDMLFKSVDFSPNENLKRLISKHIEIRNCIQHHDSRLMPDSLKRLGLQSISIRTTNPEKPILVIEWNEIILTKVELIDLCDNLSSLAQDFSKHIDIRIPARVYSKPPKQ
jgi:hypothetical protein